MTYSSSDRDIQDVGRILQALLPDVDLGSPAETLAKYIQPDLSTFRDDIARLQISIDDLPPICLEPAAAVHLGGGAVVIQVSNRQVPELKYALKVPRPSEYRGDRSQMNEQFRLAQKEYIRHAPLSHPNIARVYGAGRLSVDFESEAPIPLRPILMEWIEGPVPFNRFLLESCVDHNEVTQLIIDCLEALHTLHQDNLIHWDIKSDNLLVSRAGIVKLMDIGNARSRVDEERDRRALSTQWNLPTTLRSSVSAATEGRQSPRRTAVVIPSLEWDSPWLDLWMFALELNRILAAKKREVRPDLPEEIPTYGSSIVNAFLERCFPSHSADAQFALKYLRLVVSRLLRPSNPAASVYYLTADEVADDLKKLAPEFGAAEEVEELQAIPQKVLRLPETGNAPYTARVADVFNSDIMRRLSQHRQLGSIEHVYPGAAYVRSEHVAGVLTVTAQYVRALYADRTEPFWRIAMNKSDINALLFAALNHDIGHFAFGHYLEELRGLFEGRDHIDYAISVLDPARIERKNEAYRFGGLSRSSIEADRQLLRDILIESWGVPEDETDEFMAYVAQILRPETSGLATLYKESLLHRQQTDELKIEILHSIVDSAIDADKLDYLIRDSHHCGITYSHGIDSDRFFQALTTIPVVIPSDNPQASGELPAGKPGSIGVTEKGILPVESILLARYQMFSAVYWHHTVRAETAMLQYAVSRYVERHSEEATRALDELMQTFRTQEDAVAIATLKTRIAEQTGVNELDTKRLCRICNALLGDRRFLYKQVFVLRFEPEARGHRSDELSPAKVTYSYLTQAWREMNDVASEHDYIEKARRLRSRIATELAGFLPDSIAFEPGEVLIDIPPAGKDQVHNVFVAARGEVKPIQDHSPIADAVRDTFRFWARKVRVFMAPEALERCRAVGVERECLHEFAWEVLQKVRREHEPQRLLFDDETDS